MKLALKVLMHVEDVASRQHLSPLGLEGVHKKEFFISCTFFFSFLENISNMHLKGFGFK